MQPAALGTVLTWTRVERPPAGFAAGLVVALVEAEGGGCRYAVWEGLAEPAIGQRVRLAPRGGAWAAAP